MRVESKLITKKMPWHANMTEANHLGAALLTKPAVFESVFNQIFTSQNYASNNSLTSIFINQAREKTIDADEWEWDLKGASTRPLVIMENVEPDSNVTPGKYRTTFKLKLDEKWFMAGDVIHPGSSDKRYQVRIMEQPTKQGNGYIYIVRPMSDDPNFFIPVKYLRTGQPWAKLFSMYEEGAEQSGSTQYSLPISFKNRMSRYRKEYSVTGDAANEVLSVTIPGRDGKMYNSWIKYAEVEYWMQWYRELEMGHWYSRSTDTVLGATGRPVKSGPGIQEQLQDSHVHRYSHLTARLIEEYLMDVFYGRVKPGQKRDVVGFSGEYGMINFHRAVSDTLSKKGFIQLVDSNFAIGKTTSDYHTNSLEYGYQFTKYKMANGSTMTIMHNPLYDDREINFELDPVTGYPTESQRITFLDFGGANTSSNVTLVNRKNGFKSGYVSGLQNPYGPNNKTLMAHSGDYYEMHVQKQCGVHIEDITRCGELILSRN